MLVMMPPILPNTPNRKSQTAQAQPAWREATAVSAMTPLFWAKVVRGREVACGRELGEGEGTSCAFSHGLI
jgi:hypothetical protein